jgi:hypothetical protein
MDVNPYAAPQTPPDPPPKPPARPLEWISSPFHPATLAIVGAVLIPLLLLVAVTLLGI